MKTAMAVALLVGGVFLICVPPASDYLLSDQILEAKRQNASLSTYYWADPQMSTEYRFGCFAAGLAMIGIAVIGSRGQCSPPLDPSHSDP